MNIRYFILAERDSEGAIIEYYFFCKNECCRAYVMTVYLRYAQYLNEDIHMQE